ncbi:hypothetical protein Hdeb2414_s0003g00115691 [Helianthus debilis subsp. tardiflorus]
MALKDDKVVKPDVEEIRVKAEVSAMGSRHDKAVLARARDFAALVDIKNLMSTAGHSKVEYQYVGGYNPLLVFDDEGSAVEFVSNDLEWKKWFTHADIWVGQGVAFEGIAWLRVHSVPLHLFCNEVILDICSRYGSVAKPPQISEGDGDLSTVCVGILMGEGKRISEEVTLSWQDKKYQVWISEDIGDWIPDCLDEEFDSEESDAEDTLMGSEKMSSEFQVDQKKMGETKG